MARSVSNLAVVSTSSWFRPLLAALAGSVPLDSWFASIATLDAGDDWRDTEEWVKANSSLGVTVKVEDLRRQIDEAKEMLAQQNATRRHGIIDFSDHGSFPAPKGGFNELHEGGAYGGL